MHLPPLKDLFDFEYKGGGYFRKRGVKKGTSAPILHGEEVIKHLYDVIKNLTQSQDCATISETIEEKP